MFGNDDGVRIYQFAIKAGQDRRPYPGRLSTEAQTPGGKNAARFTLHASSYQPSALSHQQPFYYNSKDVVGLKYGPAPYSAGCAVGLVVEKHAEYSACRIFEQHAAG
jgi:hypothetical protein